MPSPRRRLLVGLTAAIVAGAACLYLARDSESIPQLVAAAKMALQKRDSVSAQKLAQQVLDRQSDHPDGLMLWAVAAAEQGHYEEALQHCRRVSHNSGAVYVDARCMAGNLCLQTLGRISEAEEEFRLVLQADRDNLVAHDRLAYLLSLQTRGWELIPHQLAMLRSGIPRRSRAHAGER